MSFKEFMLFIKSINIDKVFLYLAPFAYQPSHIYITVFLMMLASSVGFPLPEEVTLISVGLVAYIGTHPNEFKPPYPGAHAISAVEAAIVCFFIIVFCDTFIYIMGKKFGRKIIASKKFSRLVSPGAMNKIEKWTTKYGLWAVGIFRFTPGVRFPGHIACGMLGVPLYKFILIDGIAALVSVPTQILLVAYYGRPILAVIQKFKIFFFSVLAIALVIWLIRKIFFMVKNRKKDAKT